MTRDEHLKYCTICTKRKFDSKKGVVCSLTQEYANFETTCPDFYLDVVAKDTKDRYEAQNTVQAVDSDTMGLSKYGVKNGIVAGIIIIAGALTWLIVGLSAGWIFYYPIFLIIAGIVVLIKGIITESKKPGKKKISENILDEEII